MRFAAALVFFLPAGSAFLAPTAPLPRSSRAHHVSASSSFVSGVQASSQQLQQQRRQSGSSLSMVDQNVVYGGLVAFAGLAVGAGMVALTEKAGVRSEERGALSTEVSNVSCVHSRVSSLTVKMKEPQTRIAQVTRRERGVFVPREVCWVCGRLGSSPSRISMVQGFRFVLNRACHTS